MQWLWCWRCRTEMPMLDEVEYLEVFRLYCDGGSATKEFRQKWGLPLEGMDHEIRFKPLLDSYEQMTCMRERRIQTRSCITVFLCMVLHATAAGDPYDPRRRSCVEAA